MIWRQDWEDNKVPMGTFRYFYLEFLLAVDLWKIFIKNKSNQYSVLLFGTWSHILEVSRTLPQVLLGTSYLHHRRILSDGRLLFFSIIVKFLIKQIRMKNSATTSINEKSTEEGTGPSSVGGQCGCTYPGSSPLQHKLGCLFLYVYNYNATLFLLDQLSFF